MRGLLAANMVNLQKAVSSAGLCSWVASVIPRARPFVSHLWGAITDARHSQEPARSTTRRRPKDLVFVRRFRHSVEWLLALMTGDTKIMRTFSVSMRHAEVSFILRTDASPFGMGGVLFTPAGKVVGYWADSINDDDCERFQARRGDPSWQTEWEFLAIVASLGVFGAVLATGPMKIVIQTDNMAAVSAAMKLSSPKALMNTLAGELA